MTDAKLDIPVKSPTIPAALTADTKIRVRWTASPGSRP
jgi:hypothetical protein